MVNLVRQKAIGIRQAKKTLANIYKRRKSGDKRPDDQEKIEQLERTIRRWQSVNTNSNSWKL